MADQKVSDLHQTKAGVAILVAGIVQTLSQSDPSFQDRFLQNLEGPYNQLRHDANDWRHAQELLSWTLAILKDGLKLVGS